MVRLAIAFEGVLLVLAWGLGWLMGAPPFGQVLLNERALALGIAATCPPLLAMWWCSRAHWEPLRDLMFEIKEKIIPLFAGCSQWELILICALAGVGEEALFRGVIQSMLAHLTGAQVALVLTSVLFGLGHFITPTYAILAALLGYYLGWLSLILDNLLVAMTAHALYDYVALRYLIFKYKT